MKPAKRLHEILIVPLLIVGYVETLRRITFYSFGLSGQAEAFTIATIFMVALAVLHHKCQRLLVRIIGVLTTFSYYIFMIAVNYDSGSVGGKGLFLLEIPTAKGYNDVETKLIFLGVFVFYGFLIYLVARYVLERKDILELMVASVVLIGIEVLTSKVNISLLVILHIVFILLLRSSTFYLHLVSHAEFRQQGGFGSGWLRMALIATVLITATALLIPTKGSGLKITSKPVHWAKSQLVERTGVLSPEGFSSNPFVKQGDAFHVTWNRLQHFEMKGPVETSDNLVMSIKSPRAFYWRGESADLYTGSGWDNSFGINSVSDNDSQLLNPYGEGVPVKKMEFSFTIAPDLTSTVIFTPNAPESFQLPGKVYWSDDGDNYYTEEMGSGYTYKVVSYVPEYNENSLRKTKIDMSPWIETHYLQLPEDLPERVREKALQITEGLVYPYDKVKAIEAYLSKNYPYNLEVELPEKSQDIVDYFLFDLKQGYCTYHSTAMAVMLRSIDIPARWVKGYRTGNFDLQTNSYRVTEGDAHAWVEVYFGEYGWVPFEPTASFQIPAVHSESPSIAAESEPEPEESISRNMIVTKKTDAVGTSSAYKELVVPVMLFLLTTLAVFNLWFPLRKGLGAQRTDRIRDYYLDMVYLLEGKGYDRSGYQTPYEFAAVISRKFPGISQDVFILTEGYLREQYGNHNLSESHFEQLRRAWENIISTLKDRQ